ncbi:hypothetical protein XENOCAPTIV_028088, partial [Xenoophorus captivus]
LCRQRMAIRTSERVERPETLRHSRLNSVSSQFSDGPVASPSTRSSTSSWCEEPVPSNMDISTGHMILLLFVAQKSLCTIMPLFFPTPHSCLSYHKGPGPNCMQHFNSTGTCYLLCLVVPSSQFHPSAAEETAA